MDDGCTAPARSPLSRRSSPDLAQAPRSAYGSGALPASGGVAGAEPSAGRAWPWPAESFRRRLLFDISLVILYFQKKAEWRLNLNGSTAHGQQGLGFGAAALADAVERHRDLRRRHGRPLDCYAQRFRVQHQAGRGVSGSPPPPRIATRMQASVRLSQAESASISSIVPSAVQTQAGTCTAFVSLDSDME